MSSGAFHILADLVLAAHVAFVFFVVAGLLLILLGGFCDWRWVRNPWFRWAHLLAISVVVAQTWFGMICPLTTLEMVLRERGGDAAYSGTFVAHWLQAILYYDAPQWVFSVCYSLFGIAVVGSWVGFRPRAFRCSTQRAAPSS
jgi:hypothetical protein